MVLTLSTMAWCKSEDDTGGTVSAFIYSTTTVTGEVDAEAGPKHMQSNIIKVSLSTSP